MRFKILVVVYFCLSLKAAAQLNSDPETLIAKAFELSDANPAQAIKIGEHLLRNPLSNAQRCNVDYLIAKSWLAKGEYGRSLTAAFRSKQLAETGKFERKQVEVPILIAGILRTLQLDGQSGKYLDLAKYNFKLAGKSDASDEFSVRLLLADALSDADKGRVGDALNRISEAKKIAAKVSGNPHLFSDLYRVEGEIHLQRKQYEKAGKCLSESLDMLHGDERQSLLFAEASNALAAVYFQGKEHRQAVGLLLKALPVAEKLDHKPLQESINRQLAFNYLALKNQELYRDYNRRYLKTGDAVDNLESESTNVAFNLISREQELASVSKEARFQKYLYIAMAAAALALICYGLVFFRNKSRVRRYEEIRNYLELETKPADPAPASRREPSKNLVIPAETEQTLLGKLRKFELSNRFTNKEMSLAVLAAQFDTNTKYLSEIINRHSHDNFNTYINKLRIAYIVGKIRTEPNYRNYKVSYLADESGFSSHSSFATVFKSITGIAPTTFIEFVKEEEHAKKAGT